MARSRSAANAVNRLLSKTATPIYLVDEQRRITFLNDACAKWLGIAADELLGTTCNFQQVHGEGIVRIAAALCPPPECFRDRRLSRWIEITLMDGRVSRRRVQFQPLSGESDEASAVAVLVTVDCREASRQELLDPHNTPEYVKLHARLRAVREALGQVRVVHPFVGESPACRQARSQMKLALQSRDSILVSGCCAAVREQVARAIHGGRHAKHVVPLVPLSGALLDAPMLQTEILTLKRHAAEDRRQDAGTLLLLDVDLLPADAQQELLGFLNLPNFSLDLLSTTSRGYAALLADPAYSTELIRLLATLAIEMAPLADRGEDIPLLAQYLVEQHNSRGGRQLSGFTAEATDLLVQYPWPGDVPEFVDIVRQACGEAEGPFIGPQQLSANLHWALQAAGQPRREEKTIELDTMLEEVEAELIRRALLASRNNRAQAARMLGISRPRLLRRIDHFNLDPGATDDD